MDVKKLARVPLAGGWRVNGRVGSHTFEKARLTQGYDYLHECVDDFSRYAYVEALESEKGNTCAAFLQRAKSHFGERDVAIELVMTDNARNYRVSKLFQAALAPATHLLTRPYRPQTNCKAELQSHPGRRVGLRPALQVQRRAHGGPQRLPRRLQLIANTHRHRQQATRGPTSVNNGPGNYR